MPSALARWSHRIPSLRDATLRTATLRHELSRGSAARAAEALDDVCSAAERGDGPAREILAAFVPLLVDEGFAGFVDALRELAEQRAYLALGRLLRGGTRGGTPNEPGGGPVLTTPAGRPLTLGGRRALARKPTRAMLEKLLTDPHPMVTRILLDNPRLVEDDVVRMCTRRPALLHALVEIARSPEWICRRRVRLSMVLNPGSPPELTVPLLPLLLRPELDDVVEAADLPAIVRGAAVELLARRPPVGPASIGPLGAH